jgi:thiol-disulfide isomerase/thioredoxin
MKPFARSAFILSFLISSHYLQAASPSQGERAPAITPNVWVNPKQNISENYFKGRLVLLERWATWCGPCVATIPHLNTLTDQFEKNGLTIVGISQEAPQVVKNFVTKKGVKYLIGSGGVDAYDSDTIPHAWLISPKGKVLWEGHPADLDEQTIREHLKEVSAYPEFRLPAELKEAEQKLNQHHYGEGLKLLQTAADINTTTGRVAEDTIKTVTAYGRQRLKAADDLANSKNFRAAIAMTSETVEMFDGSPIADTAKTRRSQWQKHASTRPADSDAPMARGRDPV